MPCLSGLIQCLVLTLLLGAAAPVSAKWNAHYQTHASAQFENSALRGGCIRILPGQYFDAETGLYHNYFRYYDPSTGRYITPDPIGLAGGLNPYLYVEGNPVANADPSGLICGTGVCVTAAVFALTIADIVIPPSLPPEHAQDAIVPSAGPLEMLGGVAAAARIASRACGLAASGIRAEIDEVFHFTSSRNAASISETGLRAGPEGVFTTPSGNLSPLQAQIDLALSPNRGLPDALFRIDLKEVRRLGIEVNAVDLAAVARMKLAESGVNKAANLGLRHRFIQATCRRGVKSTVLGIEVSPPRQVGRAFNMPGGGTEIIIRGPVPPSALEQRIR